jgi:hypothetical protein
VGRRISLVHQLATVPGLVRLAASPEKEHFMHISVPQGDRECILALWSSMHSEATARPAQIWPDAFVCCRRGLSPAGAPILLLAHRSCPRKAGARPLISSGGFPCPWLLPAPRYAAGRRRGPLTSASNGWLCMRGTVLNDTFKREEKPVCPPS